MFHIKDTNFLDWNLNVQEEETKNLILNIFETGILSLINIFHLVI